LWAAGAAVLVALPLLVNPYLQIRSDAWTHAGIAHEILARGIPPEDPRYAGLPLNYVWFFNLFLALLSALRGHDPFALIAPFNACTLAATLLISWTVGRKLWGAAGAKGCAILAGVAFNAGVWLLWPVRLLRAFFGHDRGWSQVQDEIARLHLGDTQVIWTLSAPYAYMASFLDKLTIGTAVAFAYLLLHVHLWAMLVWLASPGPRPLLWLAAAAAGMLLFHGVVGLSYLPVVLATCALCAVLARRWRWLPGAGRLAPPVFATVLGVLAATPYTIAISRGWDPGRSGLHHRYLAFDVWTIWTMLSALAVISWLAWRPLLRSLRQRREGQALLALIALGMAAFASVVKLPIMNHVKFVYEVFVPLALLAGPQLAETFQGWVRRFGRAAAIAIAAILFGGHLAFTFVGYFLDPNGRTSEELHPTPAELRLFSWARDSTPVDAVFVDRGFRSRFMIRSQRQMLLGTPHGPELAAFPADGIRERTAVMNDLYGPIDSLERDLRGLRALDRPVYVVYRASDSAGLDPAERLGARATPLARVYDRDGFVVYHLPPPRPSGDHP
jgi:hypothetical protein